jgi:hypothetical protein
MTLYLLVFTWELEFESAKGLATAAKLWSGIIWDYGMIGGTIPFGR